MKSSIRKQRKQKQENENKQYICTYFFCKFKNVIPFPRYQFRILDATGWNFRHAFYHEENRRTLVKAYGLKFLLVVDGRAGKFDLKNTVIVLVSTSTDLQKNTRQQQALIDRTFPSKKKKVTGLGLLGLSTMFCDFVLLNYSPERKKVTWETFFF